MEETAEYDMHRSGNHQDSNWPDDGAMRTEEGIVLYTNCRPRRSLVIALGLYLMAAIDFGHLHGRSVSSEPAGNSQNGKMGLFILESSSKCQR